MTRASRRLTWLEPELGREIEAAGLSLEAAAPQWLEALRRINALYRARMRELQRCRADENQLLWAK
ncbi:MAG TPA: hypothetical protein VGJ84_01965, partial [Polyangiaceae bacterium]